MAICTENEAIKLIVTKVQCTHSLKAISVYSLSNFMVDNGYSMYEDILNFPKKVVELGGGRQEGECDISYLC